VATPEYLRQQAEILVRLAQTTHDPETAADLMKLAAECVALSEQTGRQPAGEPPIVALSEQTGRQPAGEPPISATGPTTDPPEKAVN
jgi:hypothetical protein